MRTKLRRSWLDDRLGGFARTGLAVNGKLPIPPDALKNAGVSVLLAGARYRKGSS